LTNWEASKLTTEQALYASTDAWATLLIYKELKATKSLPKKVTEALKREDIERQRQHQLEVMQSKCNNTYDNHSTQA
jgi:ribonuclease D